MNYKGQKRHAENLIIVAILIIMCFCSAVMAAEAATQKINIGEDELNNGLQFTFNNMPNSGSNSPISTHNGERLSFSGIQNFDFTPDGKYIFTSGKCYTGSTMHTMITRCLMPDSTGPEPVAECEEAFVLDKYGHGEVLAITQDDLNREAYNLWVGCDPEHKNGEHATAIARLTYEIDDNGIGHIVKKVRITGFKKANTKKGKAAFFKDKVSPLWIIAAVDVNSNQIVFRLRFKEGYGCWFLSYDFKKLNSALDAVSDNGTFKIQKAAKWQKARVKYSKSIQAFDVDGKNLYITDGKTGDKAMIYVLPYKTQSNKKISDQKKTDKNLSKIINITPAITINGERYTKEVLEIQGIKIKKNLNGNEEYYFNFLRNGTGLRNTQTLHMVTVE